MPRCKHERDISVLLPHFAQEFQKKSESTKHIDVRFGWPVVRGCGDFGWKRGLLPSPKHIELHLRCSKGSEGESDGLHSHGPF